MSSHSHFIHYPSLWSTKGKLDELTVSTECQSKLYSSAGTDSSGVTVSFWTFIIHRLMSTINSLIKAPISSWVQLSASNQVRFPCLHCELSLATCWRWLKHKLVAVSGHGSGGGFALSDWVTCVKPTCELRLAIFGIQEGSGSPPGSMALTFSILTVLLNAKSENGHGVLNFL